ncbi:glycerol-3-phosphate 1-O-acyltransferase PlsY [Ferrovibrio sp.]|uniref:glycerol-3-phosphate 1-O-acyltransferase PlsY n=1 Tax=Ferrovibrio sp. TaxID=1917215 RepID=UPI003D2CAECE
MSLDTAYILLALSCGYALGSIPFGLVLTKLAGLGDIRAIGSGNIGATNVLRTGRKDLALATLVLDGGKGTLAAILGQYFGGPDLMIVAAFAAFVGHLFPVWLKFNGGKGVATFLGVTLGLYWPLGLLCCGTWLLVAAVSRLSSLSALLAAALSPLFAWFLVSPPSQALGVALLCAVMAVLVFIRHHQNIARLLKGEEPKIGKKKADGGA